MELLLVIPNPLLLNVLPGLIETLTPDGPVSGAPKLTFPLFVIAIIALLPPEAVKFARLPLFVKLIIEFGAVELAERLLLTAVCRGAIFPAERSVKFLAVIVPPDISPVNVVIVVRSFWDPTLAAENEPVVI